MTISLSLPSFALALTLLASPLSAQEQPAPAEKAGDDERDDRKKEPRRYRVTLGGQLVPSFPGSADHSIRPLIDVSRARGADPFAFEAADESFGFALVSNGGFEAGPALNIEGSRKPGELGAPLAKVSTTFEAGGFLSYQLSEAFRLRGEVRKGLGGHDGWTGSLGADWIARKGDAWLFSLGPRVTMSDRRYHRAYFGVTAAEAGASGLAAHDPDGGVQALGATAGLLYQLTPRWGIYSYAKYDRLVGDAGRSPVVRALGSRNQLSGGLALSYTWGGGQSR